MARKQKNEDKTGVCYICGETKKLTFEHLPPRSVFNNNNAKMYDAIDINTTNNNPWDFQGLKYKQHQSGYGRHTLCELCNNNLGSWYVADYADFAVRLYETVRNHQFSQDSVVIVYATGIYPLRIIKAVLAMFCSLNFPAFVENANFRKFLMHKEEKGLGGNYGISMYTHVGSIMKLVPFSAIGYTDTGKTRGVSEISWLPFGYLLDADRENVDNFDITDFSKFGYDEKADISIVLRAREVNTTFPADFRSKKEILAQAENRASKPKARKTYE